MIYVLYLIVISIFAITAVVATREKELDLFTVIIVGVITALGGGTIRDVILGADVFWVVDQKYIWLAVISSIVTFFLIRYFIRLYPFLRYIDMLGVSIFAVAATESTIRAGYSYTIAIIMGIITAVFGGVLRDVMIGRETFLLSKELYATPILIGLLIYVLLDATISTPNFSIPFCIFFIFISYSITAYYKIPFPSCLCLKK